MVVLPFQMHVCVFIIVHLCAPPGGLGWTTASQAAMDYLVEEGSPGRDKFVRFWRLMAEAVAGHPSAFAVELMNEPMTIRRRDMFQTWRAVAEAVNAVVPDMAVSLSDVGEGAVLPAWVTEHAAKGAGVAIDQETVDWIKNSSTLYYAWHWCKRGVGECCCFFRIQICLGVDLISF